MTAQSGSVMRLCGGVLATPVDWYYHKVTGRRLVLVLNNHIGAEPYWAVMQRRIAELEARGWAVQAEGVTKPSEEELAAATDDELAARQVMLALFRDQPKAAARVLGWVHQGDKQRGLRYADDWVSADMDGLEVVRAIGPAAVLAVGRRYDEEMAMLGGRAGAYFKAITPLVYRHLAKPHDLALAELAPALGVILLDKRSRLAADAADPDRDWVVVWGAEHADGIAAALEAAGWMPTGRRRWLTVGRLPAYARSRAGIVAVRWGVRLDMWRALRSGEVDVEAAWADLKARRAAR